MALVVGIVLGFVVGAVVALVVGTVVGLVVGLLIGDVVETVVDVVVDIVAEAEEGTMVDTEVASVVGVVVGVGVLSLLFAVSVEGNVRNIATVKIMRRINLSFRFMYLARKLCHSAMGAISAAIMIAKKLAKAGNVPTAITVSRNKIVHRMIFLIVVISFISFRFVYLKNFFIISDKPKVVLR